MSSLHDIVTYLDRLLAPAEFNDSSLNGVQVEAPDKPVHSIAVAVDCGLSIVEKAVQAGAGLLIVHHGLFWGQCLPIQGALAKKINLLLAGNCSLYASHLPLDAHLEVGNAAQMAKYLGLSDIAPFCEYRGKPVGIKAQSEKPISIDALIESCSKLPGAITPTVLPFGPKTIRSVGIVTGSGAFAIHPAAREGLDLLISGEPKHEAYHTAKELGVNAIFVGHYCSETFGVRALGEMLERDLKLKSTFIHEGSGI